MHLEFARSADRHGISPERARHVIERGTMALYPIGAESDARVLFFGPDARGVPLEIGAVELADGDLLVIHAMRLRRMYHEAYEEVMRWHAR